MILIKQGLALLNQKIAGPHVGKYASSGQLKMGVGSSFPKVALNAGDNAAQGGVCMMLHAGHVFPMTDVAILTFHGRGRHDAHIIFIPWRTYPANLFFLSRKESFILIIASMHSLPSAFLVLGSLRKMDSLAWYQLYSAGVRHDLDIFMNH